jgi:hypothetical protein
MGKKIALGTPADMARRVEPVAPQSLEEQVQALSRQVAELTKAFHAVNSARVKDNRQQQVYEAIRMNHANRDGIPLGTTLVGTSMRGGVQYLTVRADGYYIGNSRYDSLSAAAEFSSGIRRSGWTFWKTFNGLTVKEAFGKI